MAHAQQVVLPMTRRCRFGNNPASAAKLIHRMQPLTAVSAAGKKAAACSGGADRDKGGLPSDVHKAQCMGDSNCHQQHPAQHPAHLCSKDQGVQGEILVHIRFDKKHILTLEGSACCLGHAMCEWQSSCQVSKPQATSIT